MTRATLVNRYGAEFYQLQPQAARGAFNPPTLQISLLRDANLSTFIHEAGHFFLHAQADMAAGIEAHKSAGAPITPAEQQLLDDVNALLAWGGVKGLEGLSALEQWHLMDLDEQRDMHERFRRGFERYAMEGRSPAVELNGAFQRFAPGWWRSTATSRP